MSFKEFFNESLLDDNKKYFKELIKEVPSEFDTEITINGLKIKKGKTVLASVSIYDLKKRVKFKDVIKRAIKNSKLKPQDIVPVKIQGYLK